MSNVKKLVITAMSIALGVILPIAFHAVPNAGTVFLPMHIPVLLCGLLCGASYGLMCGMLTPLLSSFLTGMPSPVYAPVLMAELSVYGAISGLFLHILLKKNSLTNVYISLITAMLCGRIVSGMAKAFIFHIGNYSLPIWLTASFVTALPGIVVQLTMIPILVEILKNAKVIQIQKSQS